MGTRALAWSSRILGIIVATIATSSWAADVHVSLRSSSNTVKPGSEFKVTLRCTEAGEPFNGYDATITWDPAALTFIPTSPSSLQEGNYMKNACGATFHWFQQNADNVRIGHSLWCQGVLLPGPGQLYVLRFQATGQAQTTQVALVAHEFYAAGYPVRSILESNATVTIDGTTGVASSTWSFVKSLYGE